MSFRNCEFQKALLDKRLKSRSSDDSSTGKMEMGSNSAEI